MARRSSSPLVILTLTFLGLWWYLWHSGISKGSRADYYMSQLHLTSSSTSQEARKLPTQEAFVERDGLVHLTDAARPGANSNVKVQHPTLFLIERAQQEWKRKLSSQSRDLKQAVDRYRLKYGHHPPKGFDKWCVARCFRIAVRQKSSLIK